MLAIAAMPHAQEVSAAVKGHATDGLAGQQAAQKKRKQDESEAPAGTGALQAKAAAPDADSSQHLALCPFLLHFSPCKHSCKSTGYTMLGTYPENALCEQGCVT